ncbi:NAD(+) diphosphatase [Pontibacter vulgaris]|uniref:NAD(+) diphosphatase n=1 Tax=Pontibacter vulgaris TaxID=2905679 RepID=UPI001FA78B28|nr:NAD(+) diphosphatase [Pontibacter vulgaris]
MNFYSDNPLNRRAELRTDNALMKQYLDAETTRFIVVSDAKSLLRRQEQPEVAFLLRAELDDILTLAPIQVFLGTEGEEAYVALGLEGQHEQVESLLGHTYTFQDLRGVTPFLPRQHSALLAHARAMVYWHIRHKHCSDCGEPTRSQAGGHERHCENCGKLHFPRTDTAVIVLISEGDACLLGRQAMWAPGQYATLAGFLEPGETLEQAVAREAHEETGVALQSITYHSSQPWPFPGTIMVGFMATATSRSINVNYDELEDARWFTRQEIAESLQAGTFRLPSPVSISYRLIQDWFNLDAKYKLEDLL